MRKCLVMPRLSTALAVGLGQLLNDRPADMREAGQVVRLTRSAPEPDFVLGGNRKERRSYGAGPRKRRLFRP
ncbi:hypothetical protein [Azospirillum canadense]|uniref:hypothetical protein n=1 Tax=Azospirillum canadense TaxID=403962 RepID=UPI0022270F0B|nr:hypothetical protein [Azospirillum canadense]MCW2242230.1 hypothetical protein [Azospirillum canadense]